VIADAMQNQIVDHQEIEWQFEAADLEPVESWLVEHPSTSGLAVVPVAAKELADTYYDTEDWRLYRAGYALRVRRDGQSAEATMKSLTPAEGALRRRREISEPLEGEAPKGARGPVGERLRGLAGNLRPLFEVRTRRRTFALRPERPYVDRIVEDAHPRERDAAVGELALDESEISGDGEVRTRLSRVEVEVDAGFHDVVEGFVGEMRAALDLRPTETSKFEAGLSAASLSPPGASNLGSKQRTEHSGEKDGR
jgi:triphosphatase